MKERWVLEAKRADFFGIADRLQLDPVLVRLMVNRGINTEEKIHQYLYGTLRDLESPRKMKDMEKAASLILEAIERKKKIVIASDFDVDGIFAGMILETGLQRLGGETWIMTPHRVREGYGLNVRMVEEAVRENAGLLITCDNGIAAFAALEKAKELGLCCIVTDHHEVVYREIKAGEREYILPSAAAIVNPKQKDCPYPFDGLCGAGVAYKLIALLYEERGIPSPELSLLLEYVAIATVADVMDLVGENRILVREGLQRLRKTKSPGLLALMKVNRVEPSSISAYHIGFILGPCFNATGRLETVEKALLLLRAKTEEDALDIALSLKELNDSRKEMTRLGYEKAVQQVEEKGLDQDKVLLILLEDCHESLAGIIAGRIKEKYHRPTFVFVRVEEGIKGSGRSISSYSMFESLIPCSDLFQRFGGHTMAAGISMPEENWDEFCRRIKEQCPLMPEDFIPTVRIDVAMPIGYIREDLILQIEKMEPFGKGNTKPLFAEKRFWIRRACVIGKEKNVMKLLLENQQGSQMEAIYFGGAEEFVKDACASFGEEMWKRACQGKENNLCASFAYYPTMNEFRGKRNLQVVIQHYTFLPDHSQEVRK